MVAHTGASPAVPVVATLFSIRALVALYALYRGCRGEGLCVLYGDVELVNVSGD